MSIEETILEKLKVLSPELQGEVLVFVESLTEVDPDAGRSATPDRPSILDRIQGLAAAIPDEVWNKLPADGAEHHDRYLYAPAQK